MQFPKYVNLSTLYTPLAKIRFIYLDINISQGAYSVKTGCQFTDFSLIYMIKMINFNTKWKNM